MAETLAALFDWLMGQRLMLCAERFPVIFAASAAGALILGFLLSEGNEGGKKAGYTLLTAYMLLVVGWFITSFFVRLW